MNKFLLLLLFTFVGQIQAQRSDFKTLSFDTADRIAMSLKGKKLDNLPLLAQKLTRNLNTDAEKFRAIYFWVTHNIKNDYDLMLENGRKRRKFKSDTTQLNRWHMAFKKKVFLKLLKRKSTLCSGYAYLVKELSTLAGLECDIVNGYGKTSASFKRIKTPNHAWNVIKLDGKWYVSDATWSSGFIDETYLFTFKYNDAYFLMHPEKFAESHRPIDPKWLLLESLQTSYTHKSQNRLP